MAMHDKLSLVYLVKMYFLFFTRMKSGSYIGDHFVTLVAGGCTLMRESLPLESESRKCEGEK